MKLPLTALKSIGKKFFTASDGKQGKTPLRLTIEKKWWMGEELFIDQKPAVAKSVRNKRMSG